MTTPFSSLPIVDLSILSCNSPSPDVLKALSEELYNVFATTGFAYLINAPLTFSHEDVFGLAKDFFQMDMTEKMKLAKKTFAPSNKNTYRGYFPPQPGQMDNLKEGFEVGPSVNPRKSMLGKQRKFELAESNVWPQDNSFSPSRIKLETLHTELQSLSSMLLSLIAVSLSRPADYFAPYLIDSLSTLRLLHYPPQPQSPKPTSDEIKLCCTPHTDSGILTLLHQDPTGGLEVLNADNEWIRAPYVPGSIVVNIGDLMAEVSGGRFVATMHRVRASPAGASAEDGMGRFSVPFFFEPGERCVVKSVDGGESVVYGEHVRRKMGTWVEYLHEMPERKIDGTEASRVAVEAF